MATVRGMTPEAIRALLKREVGDYNATLSVANQALSNSMAIGDSISDLDEKIKNLPDILKEGNLDLDALKGELSNLQKDLAGNKEELSSLQEDLERKERVIDSIKDSMVNENLFSPGNLIYNGFFTPSNNKTVLSWVSYESVTPEGATSPVSYGRIGRRPFFGAIIPPRHSIGVEPGYGFSITKGQEYQLRIELVGEKNVIPAGSIHVYVMTQNSQLVRITNAEDIKVKEGFFYKIGSSDVDWVAETDTVTAELCIANDNDFSVLVTNVVLQEVTGEWSLQDGAVSTNKIAVDAVTANKIAADAVTANKIAADSVTANKIAAGAVTTDKIAANAVVADKIAARSIGVQKLLVSAGNLFPDPDFLDPTWGNFSTSEGLRITANGTQSGTYYSPDGITSYTSMLLEPNAVYRLTLNLRFEASAPLSQMDVYVRYRNDVGGRKILLVGSFTKDSTNDGQYSDSSVLITMPSDMKDGRCELGFFVQKDMPSGSVDIRSARLLRATDSAMVVEGAIKADHLSAGSVTTKALSAGAVTADNIAADAITADKLSANAVTAEKIAANAITGDKIAAKTITGDQIASEAITAEKIASNSITAKQIEANAITVKELRAEVFTQVGTNVLPRVPGSDVPAWAKNENNGKTAPWYIDHSVYQGFRYYIFDGNYESVHTNRVVVDPNIEYEFSFWMKTASSSPGSIVRIELLDQSDQPAVERGGIRFTDPNTPGDAANYLVSNVSAPTQWTQYKTKISLKKNVRSVRVGTIYSYHPRGESSAAKTRIGEDMTLTPYQIPQAEIDRRQDENFVLHENQLKWLRWTKPIYEYGFPGAISGLSTIKTGLIDLEANYTDKKGGLRIITRPGWKGKFIVDYTIGEGGKQEQGTRGVAMGHSSASDYVAELVDHVHFASVTIYPDHSAEPREWVFKVFSGSIQLNTGYNGIELTAKNTFAFNCNVVANESVLSLTGKKYEQGDVIPLDTPILSTDSVSNGIIVFTEKKPRLQYEIGAPRTGGQKLEGGKIRVPRGKWTELQSWVAPAWGNGIKIRSLIAVQMSWNWWNSLASGVTYGVRVRVNNKVVYDYKTQAFGANEKTMRVDNVIRDELLSQGDVVTLEAFADPRVDIERDVLYSYMAVVWGDAVDKWD